MQVPTFPIPPLPTAAKCNRAWTNRKKSARGGTPCPLSRAEEARLSSRGPVGRSPRARRLRRPEISRLRTELPPGRRASRRRCECRGMPLPCRPGDDSVSGPLVSHPRAFPDPLLIAGPHMLSRNRPPRTRPSRMVRLSGDQTRQASACGAPPRRILTPIDLIPRSQVPLKLQMRRSP